jgi:glutaminyl-peptide cyclotransferase
MLAALLAGCAPPGGDPGGADRTTAAIRAGLAAGVPRLRPEVLGSLPHDPTAWTEGLEIDGDSLYESTGLAGRSRLRRLDPVTGATRAQVPLPDGLYGEGLTVLGDRIWQLTWRDGVVLGWDAGDRGARLAAGPPRRRPWSGEGWGLCHTADGRVLAGDGSATLRVLAGADLAPLGTLTVRVAGRELPGAIEESLDFGLAVAAVAAQSPDGAELPLLSPAGDGLRVDPEERGNFRRRQQAALRAGV